MGFNSVTLLHSSHMNRQFFYSSTPFLHKIRMTKYIFRTKNHKGYSTASLSTCPEVLFLNLS